MKMRWVYQMAKKSDERHVSNEHELAEPFNDPLTGTTWVGQYLKHSPCDTHPDHWTSFINFLHLLRSYPWHWILLLGLLENPVLYIICRMLVGKRQKSWTCQISRYSQWMWYCDSLAALCMPTAGIHLLFLGSQLMDEEWIIKSSEWFLQLMSRICRLAHIKILHIGFHLDQEGSWGVRESGR